MALFAIKNARGDCKLEKREVRMCLPAQAHAKYSRAYKAEEGACVRSVSGAQGREQ